MPQPRTPRVLAVIPARHASSRLPGKPLLRQTGRFLVQHVYERVCRARSIAHCLVATDDERIADAVRSFGGAALMTRGDHASGTDRIAEVAQRPEGRDFEIILNVQGDEPEIEPENLDRLVGALTADAGCAMATLACPFRADADPRDPNAVKVVLDAHGRALYFSRALIPWPRDAGADHARLSPAGWLLHVGVYAYRRDALLRFAAMPPGRLEQVERLEQLRALEAGWPIAVVQIERAAPGIDTPADYEAFVRRCAQAPR